MSAFYSHHRFTAGKAADIVIQLRIQQQNKQEKNKSLCQTAKSKLKGRSRLTTVSLLIQMSRRKDVQHFRFYTTEPVAHFEIKLKQNTEQF